MIGARLESGEASGSARAIPGRGQTGAAWTKWAGLEGSIVDCVGPGAWPAGRGVAMLGACPSPQLTGRHFVGAGSSALPGAVPAAGLARARPSPGQLRPRPSASLGM